MLATHDLVIRNGFLVDGSGTPGREADVAISESKVTAVGEVSGSGREEIDAKGQIVTPGFVDIHTHYDGQATWHSRLDPSSVHGVTTVVMGNCGVGFAPCKSTDHDRLIRLMEGVEDIPFPVLAEGLPWNWESFPDYMNRLAERSYDIDLAAQLPHSALRVYVMGERGANREAATEADIAAMRELAMAAMNAGALGFSTSRTLNHRTSEGDPVPTVNASEQELIGIAMGLKEVGKGVVQLVTDFNDPRKEAAMLCRIVQHTERPLSVSLAQADVAPDSWRALLDVIEQAAQTGLPIKAQVGPRPVGVLLGLELTLNPFSAHPLYQAIAKESLETRVATLNNPEFRQRLLSDKPNTDNPFLTSMLRNFGKLFVLGDPPNYEPTEDKTIAAIARSQGVSPDEVALDLMLADSGRGLLYFPFLNYAQGTLDPCYEMLQSTATLPGLSDGGAHVGMICDGSFPTTLLTHWTRDRTRGEKLPLEFAVRRQSFDTASWVGLEDRGLIAPGYRADLNIIDYDNLRLHLPTIAYDLPAQGRRLMQKASGYVATIVAGEPVYRDGVHTGAQPGRLVRGAQVAA